MRLTCPNCGAQYEVPAEVIPETGRDVQCSDCGTTWFQHHPDHPAAENVDLDNAPDMQNAEVAQEEQAGLSSADGSKTQETGFAEYTSEEEDAPEDHSTPAPEETLYEESPVPEEEDTPEDLAGPENQFDTEADLTETTGEEPVDPLAEDMVRDTDVEEPGDTSDITDNVDSGHEAAASDAPDDDAPDNESDEHDDADDDDAEEPGRRRLDDNVAAVLREEAEREAQAREDERLSGLETQTELGLVQHDSTAQQRTLEAEARMARLRGDDVLAADTAPDDEVKPPEADELGIDPASRSNLLPDIDEINSSLDPQNGRESETPPASSIDRANGQSGGFRTGFRLAILVALAGLMLYIFAPQLSGSVPQLEGALTGYVDVVDGARAQLDKLVNGIVDSIDASESE